jgi:hypothetical protein
MRPQLAFLKWFENIKLNYCYLIVHQPTIICLYFLLKNPGIDQK